MLKVFLDAGHGGSDPGAIGNNLKEKDVNLSVTLKVGEILKRHNVEVVYSRTTDVFLELNERAKRANDSNADVFVSVHCNSFTDMIAQGLETFSSTNSQKGTALAKCIQDSLIADKLYTKNRGIKTANFAVLRLTNMVAALVELAFISNKDDSEILRNKQDELALSVAKGILNFLGIKYMDKVAENKLHWGEEYYNNLAKKGVVLSEKRFDDKITRAEAMALVDKAMDVILKGGK